METYTESTILYEKLKRLCLEVGLSRKLLVLGRISILNAGKNIQKRRMSQQKLYKWVELITHVYRERGETFNISKLIQYDQCDKKTGIRIKECDSRNAFIFYILKPMKIHQERCMFLFFIQKCTLLKSTG